MHYSEYVYSVKIRDEDIPRQLGANSCSISMWGLRIGPVLINSGPNISWDAQINSRAEGGLWTQWILWGGNNAPTHSSYIHIHLINNSRYVRFQCHLMNPRLVVPCIINIGCLGHLNLFITLLTSLSFLT